MKKIISLALVCLMLVCVFAFASCSQDKKEYAALDAQDLLTEDFGIALKKGDTAMKDAVDAVINEWVSNGTMQKYVDYYTDLADYEAGVKAEAPVKGDLKTEWTFGNGGVITVYTESGFAPFEFLSGDDIIGVDIAIMSEVAERLGKSIEISDVLFDTIPTCVSTATGDAVGAAGLTINDERKLTVDFSSVYYSSTLVIVSLKDSGYTKLADLSGLKVGVQEGTSGDLIATDADSAAGYSYVNADEQEVTIKVDLADVVKYKQYSLAFEDLKNGRIDAILMDKLPALTMLNLIG